MSNPARSASSVKPVLRSIAVPLPVAKCKATTSGTRWPRFASGTRRIVSSGAPATVVAGVADGQPDTAGVGVATATGSGDDPQPASTTAKATASERPKPPAVWDGRCATLRSEYG